MSTRQRCPGAPDVCAAIVHKSTVGNRTTRPPAKSVIALLGL